MSRADGPFSTPQAVRAVVYKAATKLAGDFVLAATKGEFGQSLTSIQRADTPADVVNDWSELSTEWQVVTGLIAAVVFLLVLGVAMRILVAVVRFIDWIFVPRSLREASALPPQMVFAPPPAVDPPLRSRPRTTRRNRVVDAETEPITEEEEEEEEEKPEEQEEKESQSRE